MKSLIHKEISNYNSGNRQSEHIGKFLVVVDGWTKEDGLLDALGDPVREKLSEKYRSEIDLLYQKAAFRFRK